MKGNYFVSLNIPLDIAEEIESKIDKKKLQSNCSCKFIPVENYHLTLKFLGDISQEKADKIKEKLKEVDFEKFYLRIGRLKVFKKGLNAVIFADIASYELRGLVREIWDKIGWSSRKFKCHLTIARARKIRDFVRLEKDLGDIRFGRIEYLADEFCLMKSQLLPEGSRHNIIENYLLN